VQPAPPSRLDEPGLGLVRVAPAERVQASPHPTARRGLRTFGEEETLMKADAPSAPRARSARRAPFACPAGIAGLLCALLALSHADAVAGQLRLSWTDQAHGGASFSVERRGENEPEFTEIAVVVASTTSYLDASVVDGTTYCYRVRAFNGAGVSSYSNVACGAAQAVEIVAAVLPSSRSVEPGMAATVFATILNAAPVAASVCEIALDTTMPATLSYQALDRVTTRPIAAPDTPVDIPSGGDQPYLISLTANSPIAPTEVVLSFHCASMPPAPVVSGVNTLLFSAPESPSADVIAVVATLAGNGIVDVPAAGTGVFAVATSNVGVSASLTVAADSGAVGLPLAMTVCETDAVGGCLGPPSPTVTVRYAGGTARSFAVFAQSGGTIPFDPALNRVFVRFRNANGDLRGATSVAVRTAP